MTEPVEVEITDVEKITITKGGLARGAIKFVGTSSVRFVVSSAITTLVPAETTKEKRKVFIASMILSGMVNEKVKDYIDGEIKDKMEYVTLVIDKVKEMEQAKKLQAEGDESLSPEDVAAVAHTTQVQ